MRRLDPVPSCAGDVPVGADLYNLGCECGSLRAAKLEGAWPTEQSDARFAACCFLPMKKINLTAVPAQEARSPKGRFCQFSQDVLAALRQTNGDRLSGGQFPFEIKIVCLPPRAASGPYRSHSARWVYYQILSGRGAVRTPAGDIEVREGDCILHPPGEAHQLRNTGAVDLICHFITDNPAADACYYPDSNKWSLPGHSKPVRIHPTELYDGEE